MDSEDQAGYTSESLKMLDSAEGQLNAIFACFGSAAQHAQFFEESLAKFLLVCNKISAGSISVHDFQALEVKLQRKTMGALLREVSKYAAIEDESIAKHLDQALVSRNFLMHNLFLARKQEFMSVEGRMGLLAELAAIGKRLDQARIVVNAMRVAICGTFKFPEDGPGI